MEAQRPGGGDALDHSGRAGGRLVPAMGEGGWGAAVDGDAWGLDIAGPREVDRASGADGPAAEARRTSRTLGSGPRPTACAAGGGAAAER